VKFFLTPHSEKGKNRDLWKGCLSFYEEVEKKKDKLSAEEGRSSELCSGRIPRKENGKDTLNSGREVGGITHTPRKDSSNG